MKYTDLQEVNKHLPTMQIKGKDYVLVNSRVDAFRYLFPNGSITTDLLSVENGICIVKATVKDEEGKVLSTGLAFEKESSSYINKTSYIENCETSAVGRALGFLGIGIDISIASYEEMQNAIEQQNAKTFRNEEVEKNQYRSFIDNVYFKAFPDDEGACLKRWKIKSLDEIDNVLTREQIDSIITRMKTKLAKKNRTGVYSEEETF